MSDLCTLAEAKTHLSITTSASDAELAVFITVSSDLVEAKANRIWRDTTFTENHTGGTQDIVLRHSPVKSIPSITDNGAVISPSDYTLYSANGLIHRTYGNFTSPKGLLVVVYVAGIVTVPTLASLTLTGLRVTLPSLVTRKV